MRGTNRSVLMSFTIKEARVTLEALESAREYLAEFGKIENSKIAERLKRKLASRAERIAGFEEYDENLDI